MTSSSDLDLIAKQISETGSDSHIDRLVELAIQFTAATEKPGRAGTRWSLDRTVFSRLWVALVVWRARTSLVTKLGNRSRQLLARVESGFATAVAMKFTAEMKQVCSAFEEIGADLASWEHARQLDRLLFDAERQVTICQDSERAIDAAREVLSVPWLGLPEKLGGHFVAALGELSGARAQDLLSRLASRLDGSDERSLEGRVRDRRAEWQTLARKISDARAEVSPYALDVLRLVSTRSGIEAASIIAASLMVLGAIYSFSYYYVLGQWIPSYWTTSDLLMDGAKFAPFGALILWLTGRVVERARSKAIPAAATGSEGSTPPGAVSRFISRTGPYGVLRLNVAIAAAVAAGTAAASAWVVKGSFDKTESSEIALMTNGAVLHDMRLLGTTEKAAMFLAKESRSATSSVFAVDRAQILCVGSEDHCNRLEKPDPPPMPVSGPAPVVVPMVVPIVVEADATTPYGQAVDLHVFVATTLGCAVEEIDLPTVYFSYRGAEPCKSPVAAPGACQTPVFRAPLPEEASTRLWVVGFASKIGAPSANLNLGERRAASVRDELEARGWLDARAMSLGESVFVGAGESAAHRIGQEEDDPNDRRVEIVACRGHDSL